MMYSWYNQRTDGKHSLPNAKACMRIICVVHVGLTMSAHIDLYVECKGLNQ